MRTPLLLTGLTLSAVLLTATQLAAERAPVHPAPVMATTSSASSPPPARVYASSSDLPDGDPFPVSGTGTWHVVPGADGATGQAYTVEVEDGVTVDEQAFARFVHDTLTDPRGWGQPVHRVGAGPAAFRVRLAAQETARAVCGFEIPVDVSCRSSGLVVLSAARWFRGAVAFGGDLADYRRYVVNHEVGHLFGHPHQACPVHGGPAPVMMQQTFSTANSEIVAITGGVPQGTVIPDDGKVCTPNPWPTT